MLRAQSPHASRWICHPPGSSRLQSSINLEAEINKQFVYLFIYLFIYLFNELIMVAQCQKMSAGTPYKRKTKNRKDVRAAQQSKTVSITVAKTRTLKLLVTSLSCQAGLTFCWNKLCGRPPKYAFVPCKLNFDLLTLKVVLESSVTWATSVPILVFLGLSVLDLGPMDATETERRQTLSDVRRASSLNASALWGRRHNK